MRETRFSPKRGAAHVFGKVGSGLSVLSLEFVLALLRKWSFSMKLIRDDGGASAVLRFSLRTTDRRHCTRKPNRKTTAEVQIKTVT